MSKEYDDLLDWINESAARNRQYLLTEDVEDVEREQESRPVMSESSADYSDISDDELMAELRRSAGDVLKENPEVARGVQRRMERDAREEQAARSAEMTRIDRENRARAEAGITDMVPGGNRLATIESGVIGALRDERTKVEKLRGIREDLADWLKEGRQTEEYKNLSKSEKERVNAWGQGLLQSLSDAERVKADRPNDLNLWEESWRAYWRYGLEGDAALAGFARMLSGDRVGKKSQESFEALMQSPEYAMSSKAMEGWNMNRIAVIGTAGTLSLAESMAGAFAGELMAAGAVAKAGKVAQAAGAATKGVKALTIASKALPTVGWALPMTVRTAGQSFSENMDYWQGRSDLSDSEKYWKSVGQALTDAGIEFTSENIEYLAGLGASKVMSRFGKIRRPVEQMTIRAVKDGLGNKLLKIGLEGFTSFAEEDMEEVFSDWGQELSKMYWRGDSDIRKTWRSAGMKGVGDWATERLMESSVGVASTLLLGAYHGARANQWNGVQDWFTRPGEVLEDYGIKDEQAGQLATLAIKSLLQGDEKRADDCVKMLQMLDTDDSRRGAELVGQIQQGAKRFGADGLLEDADDATREAGAVDVVEFDSSDDNGAKKYLIIIGRGTDASSVCVADNAEQAAFIQEMARSRALGVLSPYLAKLPDADAYAVKRDNGGWAVYSYDGKMLLDNVASPYYDGHDLWGDRTDVQPLQAPKATLPLPAKVVTSATTAATTAATTPAPAQTVAQAPAQNPAPAQTVAQNPVQTVAQNPVAAPPTNNAQADNTRPAVTPTQEAADAHDAATMQPIVDAVEAGKEGMREGLQGEIDELESKENLSDEEKAKLQDLRDALDDLDNPKAPEDVADELGETEKSAETEKPAEPFVKVAGRVYATREDAERRLSDLRELDANSYKTGDDLSPEERREMDELAKLLGESEDTTNDEKSVSESKPVADEASEQSKPVRKDKLDLAPLQLNSIEKVDKVPSDVQWTDKKYKDDEFFWNVVRLGIKDDDAYFKMTGRGVKTVFLKISDFKNKTVARVEYELTEWSESGEAYPLGRNFSNALEDLADYGMLLGYSQPITRPMTSEAAKPVETEKPTEAAKPTEDAKPAETEKPTETAKPAETEKPAETGKPAENESSEPEGEESAAQGDGVDSSENSKHPIIRATEIVKRLSRGVSHSVRIEKADGTIEGPVRYDATVLGPRRFIWDNGKTSNAMELAFIIRDAIESGEVVLEETAEVVTPLEGVQPTEVESQKPDGEKSAEGETPNKGEESGNALEEQEKREAEKIRNLTGDAYQRYVDLAKDLKMTAAEKRRVLNRLANEDGLAVKTAEEIVEHRVVVEMRRIAGKGKLSLEQKWEAVKNLYEHQPAFSTRTSTSMMNQAYSTPIPISFMGGIRIGGDNSSVVYEPTAGTGSLVAVAASRFATVYANELAPVRFAILEALDASYNATQGDALARKNDEPVDIVMTNPPFANASPMKFGDFTLTKLDHQIAAHALNDLKPNGRALVIVGANMRKGENIPTFADHVFMNFLYTNFNVKDNYVLDGSLYRKQGATVPIRLITIDGRRKASEGVVESPTDIKTLKTFDEVYEALKEELPQNGQGASTEGLQDYVYSEGRPGALSSDNDQQDGGAAENGGRVPSRSGQPADGSRPGGSAIQGASENGEGNAQADNGAGSDGRGGVRSGDGRGSDTESNANGVQGNSEGVVQEPQSEGTEGGRELGDVSSRPSEQNGENGRADGVGADGGVEPSGVKVGHKVGDKYNSYISVSRSNSIGTVVNSNLAEATTVALNELQDAVGDVDEYVRQELGYESKDELYKGLAAEQIDGVALAIRQLSQNYGFLIGDVTGLGKGRQAAAIIRWAQKHDKLPIFFTEKPSLFSSMYYDGQDIGSDFKPLLMGNPKEGRIFTRDGETLLFKPFENKPLADALSSLADGKGDYDCLFTNYSQFNKDVDSAKKRAFDAVLKNRDVVFILDEAHNAAGDSQTGKSVRRMIAGKPVLYSSATAIKRPDNLPVYYRMKIFGGKPNEDLVDVLTSGGPVLMQLFTQKMVSDGSYVRREKDLSDVKFEMKTVEPQNYEKVKSDADKLSIAFRKIVALSELVKAVIKKRNHYAKGTGSGGVRYVGFASTLSNFVSQYLLAAKIDNAVEESVAALKRGEKVVIALTNTMESVLEDFVEAQGVSKGDVVTLQYADVLRRYVSGVNGDGRGRLFRATQPKPNGEGSITVQYTPAELGLQAQYDVLVDELEDVLGGVDFPLSPIDMIEAKIRRAGYDTGEITKRENIIDYDLDNDSAKLNKRAVESTNVTINRFNNGGIDFLVLNAAGSTGISLHASEKVKDQRPRRMIILQPSLDINTVIQTLGRINRTGQVVKPFFTFLSTPLTAEVRPNFMLAKKMRSLGAATSGDQKGDVDLGTDFINEYGDTVAAEWLLQNDDLRKVMALDEPLELNGEIVGNDGLMAQLTGRTVLFDDATQKAIFDELAENYNEKIDELKRLGKYTLDVNQYDDWNAVVKDVSKVTDDVDVRLLEIDEKRDIPSAKNVLAEFNAKIKEPERLNDIFVEMNRMVDEMPSVYEDGQNDDDMFGKQAAERRSINELVLKMRNLFEERRADGKRVILPRVLKLVIDGAVFPVALIDVKSRLVNKRHPGNQGQVKFKFAVAGPVKKIVVPANKLMFVDESQLKNSIFYFASVTDDSLESVFTGERKTFRSGRYVFTGDLVQGYRMSGDGRQTVAKYRYKDGREEIGVIQPAGWSQTLMAYDPRLSLNTIDDVKQYFSNADYHSSAFSHDGVLKISKEYNGWYYLYARISGRAGGRRYATDEDILAVTGNWHREHNRNVVNMRVDILDKNLERLLKVLYDKKITLRKPKPGTTEASPNSYRVGVFSGDLRESKPVGLTKDVVNRLSERLGLGGVVVVNDDEELPYHIREDVYSDRMGGYLNGEWKGIYRDGVCYINASAHADERDAVVSILHEAVVHKGLRCLFESDDELNEFLDKCYGGFMRLRYAADNKIAAGLERYKAIEESIADFADNDQYAPIYIKVYNWLKQAISKLLRAIGLTRGIPEDVELRDILKRAGEAARTRAPYDSNSPVGSLYTTSSELERRFPRWRENATTEKGGHKTQIAGTVATYSKIGEHLLEEGFNGRILDASSGKGIGTAALREMGFEVDDVEPYPSRGYQPKFDSYDDVKGKYDLVISNAVLNVVEDDVRNDLLSRMGKLVAPGGRLFINVRPANAIETQVKNKVELDSPSEVMVMDSKGKPQSYQKGFTPSELMEYVQKGLGAEFSVAKATGANIGTAGGVAVVATRNGERKVDAAHFGKVYYRMSLSARRQSALDWLSDKLNKGGVLRQLPWGEIRGGVRPFVNRTMWQAKGELNAEQEGVRVLLQEMNDASRAIAKEVWAKDVYDDMDGLLRDKIALNKVSHANDARVQTLVAAVMRGRKAIDGLSLRIVSEMGGLLPTTTGLAIQNNVGTYTIRAYEKFLNPKYEPTQDAIDNAKAAIETEFYNRFDALKAHINATNYVQGAKRQLMLNYLVTRDDNLLNGQSGAFVRRAKIYTTLIDNASVFCNDAIAAAVNGNDFDINVDAQVLANTVQGTVDMLLSKDVENAGYDRSSARWKIARQSFLHRKDLPGWLRELYGEITDYGASVAVTLNRSVRVLTMNKMYRALLDYNNSLPMSAKDRIFYDAPYTDGKKKCDVKMSGFGFGVLRNMYTDRNTYNMLNSYSSESNLPLYLRRWIVAMRMSKTVLNVPTHMRNMLGNVSFALGDAEILRNPKAYSAAFVQGLKVLSGKDGASLAARQGLMKLGVIGAGAHAEMYSRTMEELFKDYEDGRIKGFWSVVDWIRNKYGKTMESLYGGEDNMFRAAAYYSKVRRGMSPEVAAEEVSNLYPTYDRAPVLVDEMRKKYLLSPDFMSFRFEALRCLVNEMKMAYDGAKHGDFYRVVGLMLNLLSSNSFTASGLTGLLLALVSKVLRDDDDEEAKKSLLMPSELNAMRVLLPDYRKNNLVWAWRVKEGLRYVDAEYFYPFEQVSLICSLLFSGEPMGARVNELLKHFRDNYALGGIIPKAIAEQLVNSNGDGDKITRDYDSLAQSALKRGQHAVSTIVPPMLTFGARAVNLALIGDDKVVDANGDVRTAGNEFKKMVMPLRVYQLDPESAYLRRMRRLSGDIRETRWKASAVVRRWQRGETTKADAQRAIDVASGELDDSLLMEAVYATDEAGRTLGLSYSRREQLLKDAGFSLDDARRILSRSPLVYKMPNK